MARSAAAAPSGTIDEPIAPMIRWLAAVLALLLSTGAGRTAENLATGEVVDRSALRVCADPAQLPFSNEAGEGFENRIAELMAKSMELPLTYVWYPRTVGFVRNTLRARLCDLVMGVVSTHELMQNTNPYYRSTYVMAFRAADAGRFGSQESPALREATIGVVAGTPPAEILAREGLLERVRSYQLHTDSRIADPLRDMVEDLAAGRIDVAMGWGPAIGYWAARAAEEVDLVPLESDIPTLRLDFRISMGVRWGEPAWKRTVNEQIARLQPEITAILLEYGVPLLDRRGELIEAAPSVASPEIAPEPEGYRMSAYRAPVPATLDGATVVGTADGLEALMRKREPLLIDVLPRQPKPENRNPALPWIEKRETIPGAFWLPNTGFGELPPATMAYFQDTLERLTGGDKAKPLVFFCEPQCWQSWNAARRALTELGYTQVYWYPEGTAGWKEAGQLLIGAKPEAMP